MKSPDSARLKYPAANTGLPDPFHVYACYKVQKRLDDLKLHSLIDSLDPSLRHSQNREFYEMSGSKAFSILTAIAQINGVDECLTFNPNNDQYVADLDTKPVDPPKPPKRGILPDGIYTMSRKLKEENAVANARMEIKDGNVFLKAGSYVSSIERAGMTDTIRSIKKSASVINHILQSDISCSLNEAAAIVTSGSVNAWTAWKDMNGHLIDDYRKGVIT